jgi:tRNA pseudouridine38-40 synthase
MKLIIESNDRSEAGFSVPAKGLFLTKIIYPSNIFLK